MKTQEFTGIPIVLTVPGNILRQELDARGLSQRAFAEMTGRPEQAVSEIIRGKKRITADTALDFAVRTDAETIDLAVELAADATKLDPRARARHAATPSGSKDAVRSAAREPLPLPLGPERNGERYCAGPEPAVGLGARTRVRVPAIPTPRSGWRPQGQQRP